MSGIWGPLVTEVDIDTAVVLTLRKWLPYYLTQAEDERDLDIGTLARPKEQSYSNTLTDDEFLDHQLPAVIVTTATAEAPAMNGDGVYSVRFQCRVSSIVRGREPPEARAVAATFSACVRRVIVQQGTLGGRADGTRWRSGMVAPVADDTGDGRWLAAGMNDFFIFHDSVVDAGGGPRDPKVVYPPPDQPDEPWDPLASVTDVTVSVTEKES